MRVVLLQIHIIFFHLSSAARGTRIRAHNSACYIILQSEFQLCETNLQFVFVFGHSRLQQRSVVALAHHLSLDRTSAREQGLHWPHFQVNYYKNQVIQH